MNRIFTLLLVLIALFSFASCQQSKGDHAQQQVKTLDLNLFPKQYTTLQLPPELKEISGIAFIDSTVVLAIEDEDGILFRYDLEKEKITGKTRFAGKGDYEDLAVVKNDVYVVDSKGDLFYIKGFLTGKHQALKIKTPLSKKNDVEGLAYDAAHNRLLIAAKAKGMQEKTDKEIYQYDIAANALDTIPAYSVRLSAVENYFKGDAIEESSKKFLKALGNENMNKVFTTSAIAVHPVNGQLYVLSSVNNLIAILDDRSKILKMITLRGKEFSQPEGLAFGPGQKLYLSNEGKKRPANIIRLDDEQ